MVQEEIVLGHWISAKRIEVDRAKIHVIEKLSPSMSVKSIRKFLEHPRYYRKFIKDFSKITKSLCNLLVKDVIFYFSDECLLNFNTLKEKLISSPVIIALNWSFLFKLMCEQVITLWGHIGIA